MEVEELFRKPDFSVDSMDLEKRIKGVLFSPDHDDLGEAIIADLVDAIPFIGDLTNLIRVANAVTSRENEFITALQTGDLIMGFFGELLEASTLEAIPIDFIDLLTPTNTISYFIRKTDLGKELSTFLSLPAALRK